MLHGPKIRLYVDHPLATGERVALSRDQAHYLFGVMRLRVGAELALINGRDGEWRAEVAEAGKRAGVLAIAEQLRPLQLPPDLWLLFAPIKKARTDFIVEKAAELGAARICPVQTAHTNAERIRRDRLQAHVVEAVEQCGGTFVPEVTDLAPLDRVLAEWPEGRQLIFADEALVGAQTTLDALPDGGPWAILTGPEGGFSEPERTRLRAMPSVTPLSLGPSNSARGYRRGGRAHALPSPQGGLDMMRKATPQDAATIEAFLVPHAETSMFLRSNLAAHGVAQTDHAHSTDFYLWEDPVLSAVFGRTRAGFLLAQMPNARPEPTAAFAAAIAGQTALGMTGTKAQVWAVLEACGLAKASFGLNQEEPLYRQELRALKDPGVTTRPVSNADIVFLSGWFKDYMIETNSVPPGEDPDAAGRRRAKGAVDGALRLMTEGGVPCAMASLNAQVADLVQVGGVYVPPALRRAGRGGKITAGLLAEARANGAKTAILFAVSEAAAKVYEAIGFELIGTYQIALLAEPARVQP